jgi:hypothetical protein
MKRRDPSVNLLLPFPIYRLILMSALGGNEEHANEFQPISAGYKTACLAMAASLQLQIGY